MSQLTSLCLPAPAKINLILKILGRTPDGMHHLQSAIQLIDLQDLICFRLRDDGQILLHTKHQSIPADENLIVKAAKSICKQSTIPLGCDIFWSQRIPMGAGLGGGSSDAATTLVALNALWQLQLPAEQLINLAVGLGSDIALFVQGENGWLQGQGDFGQSDLFYPHLSPCFLLIYPNLHASTKHWYQHPDLQRNQLPISPQQWQTHLGENSFFDLLLSEWPAWRDFYQQLPKPPHHGFYLTGSGSAVWTVCDSYIQARQLQAQLASHLTSWIVHPIAKSPISSALTRWYQQ